MVNKLVSPSLYGLILSGGKSTRMKKDKSLLNYHGKAQVVVGYELLAKFCEKVFVSNRPDQKNLPGHQGLPQLPDACKYANQGPLAGILTAMNRFPRRAWLVLACDLPFVNDATLRYLIASRDVRAEATAYQSSTDQLPEPLCAIYEPTFRLKLNKFFKQGILCPRKCLLKSSVKLLISKTKFALDNVNHPDDYRQAQQRLKISR